MSASMSWSLPWILALAVAPRLEAAGDPPPPEHARNTRLDRVAVDAEPGYRDSLLDALRLRLPEVRFEQFAPGAAETGERSVHLRIRRGDAGRYHVTVITADGRGYLRSIDAPEPDVARTLGAELAVLLQGIADETIPPDRENLRVEELEPAAVPTPTRETETAPVEPAPPVAPTTAGKAVEDATRPPPRIQLGVHAIVGGAFGFVPTDDIAASGAGLAELAADIRGRHDGVLRLAVRMGGARTADVSVLRVRVAIGGGYVVGGGPFEMPLLATATVEPWVVRAASKRVSLTTADGGMDRPIPLLGFALRAAPGLALPLRDEGGPTVRIGLPLELAASAILRDGARVPRLFDGTGTTVLRRLGGVEMFVGLHVGIWLPIGPTRGE